MEIRRKQHYLLSIDILKGLAVFPMVIGHSLQWWDRSFVNNYEQNASLIPLIAIVIGLMVLPLFLFIYGFNQTNSFFRHNKNPNGKTKEIRVHAIKRGILFLLLATIAQFFMWIVRSFPNLEIQKLPNYLVSWHLFHIFSFTTFFLLLVWELSLSIRHKLKVQFYIYKIFMFLILCFAILTIFLFILFHNYTLTHPIVFPIEFNLNRVLEHILLDIGSAGLIPWLFFPLLGAFLASYLVLPENKKNLSNKKLLLPLMLSGVLLFLGFITLAFERYASPALLSPSTYPRVFISSGYILLSFLFLLTVIDLKNIIPKEKILKLISPIFIVSDITLTVYFIHPVIFILNPELIHTETQIMLLASFYSLSFIFIAWLWKKFDYRFSLEYFIKKLT